MEPPKSSPAAKTPAVSVCVPTYNYGRFLTDCIESVLQQDFSDLELVITDDNSTDGTAELVARFAAADPRVRYIKNEQRLGMNANIKRAADLARGRYIKMLCADDWIAPRCLSRMVDLMEQNPDVTLGTSACIVAAEDGRALKVEFLFGQNVSRIPGDEMLERMARGEGFGGNSSFFIRAEAYKKVGGYDGAIPYAADYHLAARLCQIGDYLHTDEPLFYGRLQATASSLTDPAKLLDVPDWFTIPQKIFRPRPAFSRSWRRYQQLSGLLTARYITQLGLEYARGHRAYAGALQNVLAREGNFLVGVPLLPLHIALRAVRRVTGTHLPAFRPPEPWMGPPPHTTLQNHREARP
ncbi:MAG: glycosyltransferase family 2 protein [Polyangiaceae bacterium]|nr:glycosyltransferase family 2 protein [Polyangiaceae bacterium]